MLLLTRLFSVCQNWESLGCRVWGSVSGFEFQKLRIGIQNPIVQSGNT